VRSVRRSRRSLVGLGIVLVAGVAVAGVSAVVPGGAAPHEASPGEQAIRVVQDAMDVPEGMTLVGYRDLAVTVPETWSRDGVQCGTPAEDTVVRPLGPICLALVGYRSGISSVELKASWGYYPPESAPPTEIVVLDGREFESTGIVCPETDAEWGISRPCRVELTSTTDGTTIILSSSLTPETAARDQLDELVAGVRVLGPETTVVPGQFDDPDPLRSVLELRDATEYADLLVDAGLVPRIEEVDVPPAQEGSVQGLSPVPGSVLPRGTEVTIYAAAAPQTPADEISVDATYSRPDNGTMISDEEIRRGTTIQVELGDSIIVTGQKQLVEGTEEYDEAAENGFSDLYVLLGGTLDGSSIEVVENDRVAMWQAVELGTTVLTVTYEKDGRAYDVGTIDVEVIG